MITLAHGAGGTIMQGFIKENLLKILAPTTFEVPLEALDDAAVVNGVVFTTDTYTVKPLFFPGGDIGRLAVAGTVNDIAVLGGEPAAISLAFVIEEGFPLSDLEKILWSVKTTADEAGVQIATGDTKVVERGAIDKLVVNTSGIGFRSSALDHNLQIAKRYRPSVDKNWLLDSNVRPGDQIILSGPIGDHGVAIMSAREGYGFETQIVSDATPLNKMIRSALDVGGVVAIKDPTRGGIANLLNEWSDKSKVGINIWESKIPIRPGVRGALEFLGIDPLIVGNEGKVVMAVVPEMAEAVLETMHRTPEGQQAVIMGEATGEHDIVVLQTVVGGNRIISPPAGDPIPRIC
ncbi:MAG: hydrogenase expression/formation protein HypE [Nitrososphaerales archaeon]|nr:hydrogenase expression/formation protein HypE [Nitrososphaerales archaeon]